MTNIEAQASAPDIADLLGSSFPGHTMQRIRTAAGAYRYSYVSPSVQESFGLDPKALMEMPAVDHAWVHPDDRARFVAALERSAAELSRLDEEIRVARAGGGYKWVRSLGTPRRQPDGSVIWDGVALDVTERREALEALQRTLVQVRNDEASEGRLSYIAAADVSARDRVIGSGGRASCGHRGRRGLRRVRKRLLRGARPCRASSAEKRGPNRRARARDATAGRDPRQAFPRRFERRDRTAAWPHRGNSETSCLCRF
jgi:PAS domain S-box-containing protein